MKKRGISEIVSYTLLIVISISLAVLVFNYLKSYTPKDKPECKEGINIVIEQAECDFVAGELKITLENRGRFKVERAFVRIGKEGEIKKSLQPSPLPLTSGGGSVNYLGPGNLSDSYSLSGLLGAINAAGDYVLEIQPAHFTKEGNTNPNTLALCPAVTENIVC